MNSKKVKNINLSTEIASSGTISIYEMNEESLVELGFLDSDGWPSGAFVQVLKDLDTISPTDFDHDAKFWDSIQGGFSIYNKFFEDGEND